MIVLPKSVEAPPAATNLSVARAAVANCAPLLDQYEQCLPNGAPQPIRQHQEKAILAVNTASFCAMAAQFGCPAFVDDKCLV